jgi:hypothetical protein
MLSSRRPCECNGALWVPGEDFVLGIDPHLAAFSDTTPNKPSSPCGPLLFVVKKTCRVPQDIEPVFLLVFVATLPVVIPFLLFSDPRWALRASNGVAILMLFLTGFALGRHAGRRPWLIGLAMIILQ